MTTDNFSFRWGIDIFDAGYTTIPNVLIRNYHHVASYKEFALIVHLSSYQFEKPNSECRPSINSIAVQMGLSKRTVQRFLSDLENRGLLHRRFRDGETTIYDFSGFSKAVLAHALTHDSTDTHDSTVTPTHDSTVTPPMTVLSPKEQQEKKQTSMLNDDYDKETLEVLLSFGIDQSMAKKLARSCSKELATAWVDYATEKGETLRNAQGFVVSKLKLGAMPEVKKKQKKEVKFLTCPTCYTTQHSSRFCSHCGKCPDCCECEHEDAGGEYG